MTDDRWNALTAEQQAFLLKLGRVPWSWFVSDRRYAATLARMERENRWAAEQAVAAKQRAYWAAVASRTTGYTGPDYRIKLEEQESWIRAYEQQYDNALTTGTPRSIGVPEAVA